MCISDGPQNKHTKNAPRLPWFPECTIDCYQKIKLSALHLLCKFRASCSCHADHQSHDHRPQSAPVEKLMCFNLIMEVCFSRSHFPIISIAVSKTTEESLSGNSKEDGPFENHTAWEKVQSWSCPNNQVIRQSWCLCQVQYGSMIYQAVLLRKLANEDSETILLIIIQ